LTHREKPVQTLAFSTSQLVPLRNGQWDAELGVYGVSVGPSWGDNVGGFAEVYNSQAAEFGGGVTVCPVMPLNQKSNLEQKIMGKKHLLAGFIKPFSSFQLVTT
jgi:hypothetical protein